MDLNLFTYFEPRIRVLLADCDGCGMIDSMRLNVFLEHSAIAAHPTNCYKSRMIAFIDALHFSSAFWMITFWVLDVWYERYIQLSKGLS
jgi:hypothetical protein